VFRDAVDALLVEGIPFAVAGSIATWTHGGPEPPLVDDIDLVAREQDVVAAAVALRRAGLELEVPPEGWLVKAHHDLCNDRGERVFVDVITCMAGLPVDDEVLARCHVLHVTGVPVPCLAPVDQMTGTVLSLSPAMLDFRGAIEKARVLREQFDWDELERRATGYPAAEAFFDVARRLGVDPRTPDEHQRRIATTEPGAPVRTYDAQTRGRLHEVASLREVDG
jgi:hypothetical protein